MYFSQLNDWKSSEKKLLEIFPKPDRTDKEHNTFIKETLSIYFLFHFQLMSVFPFKSYLLLHFVYTFLFI